MRFWEIIRNSLFWRALLMGRLYLLPLVAFGAVSADASAESLFVDLETTKGKIELELTPDKTPITVANFVNLVQRGFYDGITFHRVISDFMIQGGDPEGTGRGGPGYNFQDEFDSSLRHSGPGILSMANSGPNSNGSQFFITHLATPHLDNRHSVFGRVVSGQDVVNAIRQGDKIEKATVRGDADAHLEKMSEHVEKWNAILDR